MTVELKPMGSKCNLHCSYCYEAPNRAVQVGYVYDVDAILKTASKYDCKFSMFGGEPLLIPDLEKFFKFGHDHFKSNGLQTNGLLLTDAHIEMFKKYQVHVGFSIDGIGKMNSPRCNENLTKRANENLQRCIKADLNVSLISTIHKANANSDFIIWLSSLEDMGLTYVNLHLLENDNNTGLRLTNKEAIEFWGLLYDASKHFKRLKIGNFEEMVSRLFTGAGGTCVWNSCDPYTTSAVQGIGPNGEMHNCGRNSKDGVDYIKADFYHPMREMVLQSTPWESGGCQGCRYWHACRGFCPGSGLDGDWRNRSEHCESLKSIFSWLETDKVKVEVREKCES